MSQGTRNHARCFKQRGYKTGNWLHRCWKTGRTERGRRINPVINDRRKQLPLLEQNRTKGPVSTEEGLVPPEAHLWRKQPLPAAPAGSRDAATSTTHHQGREETEGTIASLFLPPSDRPQCPPLVEPSNKSTSKGAREPWLQTPSLSLAKGNMRRVDTRQRDNSKEQFVNLYC